MSCDERRSEAPRFFTLVNGPNDAWFYRERRLPRTRRDIYHELSRDTRVLVADRSHRSRSLFASWIRVLIERPIHGEGGKIDREHTHTRVNWSKWPARVYCRLGEDGWIEIDEGSWCDSSCHSRAVVLNLFEVQGTLLIVWKICGVLTKINDPKKRTETSRVEINIFWKNILLNIFKFYILKYIGKFLQSRNNNEKKKFGFHNFAEHRLRTSVLEVRGLVEFWWKDDV